jgi:hypothetical protein
MEDKRSIKKVLESRGDVQLGVQDHLIFKMTSRSHTISVLDALHMQGKLRR